MLDDNDDQVRASIRAQANSDAQAFLAQMLESETDTGIPPPPTIEISETSSEPIKLDFLGFGRQGSSTRPGAGSQQGSSPCPTASQLQVVFSGVLNCGCIDLNGSDSEAVFEDPLPINTTFIVDLQSPGFWDSTLQPDVNVTLLAYIGSAVCGGVPTNVNVYPIRVVIECGGDFPTWSINAYFHDGAQLPLFRAEGSTPMPLGSAQSNILVCGIGTDAHTVHGFDGTVTVTAI